MRERPIIFSSEMVRAILDGRKTMTRRAIKKQPGPTTTGYLELSAGQFKPIRSLPEFDGKIGSESHKKALAVFYSDEINETLHCLYGQPGDRLWVKETWVHVPGGGVDATFYKAGINQEDRTWLETFGWKWKSSLFMPKSESRITLEITGVRVERVQDINSDRHDDVLKEGWPFDEEGIEENPVLSFRYYWDSLNAKRGYGWDANCYVWVIEFKRVEEEKI